MRSILILFLLAGLVLACSRDNKTTNADDQNPAAVGFNYENSDSIAMALADEVMMAMGGRKSWDTTRYIAWTFFNRRRLLWDKYSGDVRIDFLNNPETIFLVNINDNQGRIQIDGIETQHPDSLSKYLTRAKSIWINDSYWLFMPFKLKDSGVTLKYLGEDTTMRGEQAYTLGLTFDNVGDTPQNKYKVWVHPETKLVIQWAYYRNADQDSANFVREWGNYKNYGNLLLSGDRSDGGPGDIKVYDEIDTSYLKNFTPMHY